MTTGINIKLSLVELLYAANVGVVRHYESYIAKLTKKNFFDTEKSNALVNDVEAACGEMAAARALNLYYEGPVNTFKKPDVGGKYQVRFSQSNNNRLIVRPEDKDNEIFIFVSGFSPEFWVRGWLLGSDAKKDQYWESYHGKPGAWFVPVSHLHPMESIPK